MQKLEIAGCEVQNGDWLQFRHSSSPYREGHVILLSRHGAITFIWGSQDLQRDEIVVSSTGLVEEYLPYLADI